jgi:hypothetical protein
MKLTAMSNMILGVTSEMSGGVHNVAVSNCVFQGTDVGIRMKSQRGRGGENRRTDHWSSRDGRRKHDFLQCSHTGALTMTNCSNIDTARLKSRTANPVVESK